jgi:GntR family transcriptional regulator, rspAB operon transcriptional repressor
VPQRGTFVLKISLREVQNAQFVREAIEVAVARRACEVGTASDIRAIASVVEEQKEAFAASDYPRFLRLDEAFHQRIAEAARRQAARKSIGAVLAQLDRVRFLSLPLLSHIPTIIETHERILAALEARSADDAEHIMREHVSAIFSYLPEIARRYPDMFAESVRAIGEHAPD